MGKTPEAKERDPTVKFAKSLGVEVIRMHFGPGVQVGWPDDLFLIPGGTPLFLEAKARGKKPTEKQLAKIKKLEDLGYDVGWYDNKDEAIEAITRAVEAALLSGNGHRLSCEPGRCGFVPRSRFRENLDNLKRLLHAARRRLSKTDARRRTT